MFICIYMNILIYNQERKECTIQKKIFIYRSINKQRHTWFCILHGFCVLGESRKSKTKQKKAAVRKSLETLLLDWKMAPGTSSGEPKEGKARHTHTQPRQLVSSFEPFSCKHSLFVRTETGSKHKRYVIVNTWYDDDEDDDDDDRSNIDLISLKKMKKKKGPQVWEIQHKVHTRWQFQ